MEIVFRKRITTGDFHAGQEGQVLNRYRLPIAARFTQSEIELIASELYELDYGHRLKEDRHVYWTLE